MGFHEIPSKQGGHLGPANTVRVRLAAPSRKSSGLGLDVYISADVARSLGWKIGGRVQFLFGRDDADGKDTGKLRLEPATKDRGNRLTGRHGSRNQATERLRVSTVRLPDEMKRLPPCAFDAEFEVGKRPAAELTITLPFAPFNAAAAAAE